MYCNSVIKPLFKVNRGISARPPLARGGRGKMGGGLEMGDGKRWLGAGETNGPLIMGGRAAACLTSDSETSPARTDRLRIIAIKSDVPGVTAPAPRSPIRARPAATAAACRVSWTSLLSRSDRSSNHCPHSSTPETRPRCQASLFAFTSIAGCLYTRPPSVRPSLSVLHVNVRSSYTGCFISLFIMLNLYFGDSKKVEN